MEVRIRLIHFQHLVFLSTALIATSVTRTSQEALAVGSMTTKKKKELRGQRDGAGLNLPNVRKKMKSVKLGTSAGEPGKKTSTAN